MSSRGWLLGAGAFALLASACAGGQSGVELDPGPLCNVMARGTVAPDQVTANGTVELLAAEVEQPTSVPMHVFDHPGGGPGVDTTLTLVASVDRSSGQDVQRVSGGGVPDACRTLLTARAVLHFDAADGSYSEVFDGTIEKDGEQAWFSATIPLQEHRGTLDLTALAKNYSNPVLNVRTRLGSMPSGELSLEGDANDSDPNTVAGPAGLAAWP